MRLVLFLILFLSILGCVSNKEQTLKRTRFTKSLDILIENQNFNYIQENGLSFVSIDIKDFDSCYSTVNGNFQLLLFSSKTPGSVSKNRHLFYLFKDSIQVFSALIYNPYFPPKIGFISSQICFWDEAIEWGTGIKKYKRSFLKLENFKLLQTLLLYSGGTTCNYSAKVELVDQSFNNDMLTLKYNFIFNSDTEEIKQEKKLVFSTNFIDILKSKSEINDSIYKLINKIPCSEYNFKKLTNYFKNE